MARLQLILEKTVEGLVLLNELVDSLTILIHSMG
ncbi:hypothetical protein D104_02825 [Marinomonas profundimaris]|uniref:Uncharacterized protein n=1 Tax=Marinomonas profundimaris TaxID=1208321 RepID=W1RY63_9GAMM|nr:hypothetical protein D104_02825 [Marinomonas profundimaris]